MTACLVALLFLGAGLAWWISRSSDAWCGRSPLLVQSCGVMWGIASDPPSLEGVAAAERATNHHFDLIHRFNYLDDVVPSQDERAVVRQGRVLYVSIAARFRRSGLPARWADVAAGRFDSELTAQARGLSSLHARVFITFEHEPDRDDRTATGSPRQFVAAWRHVHDVFARAGAHQLVWAWVVTGYPPFIARAAEMWPGNDVVDWIGWEAYNGSGCPRREPDPERYTTFAEDALPFYDWLLLHGAEHGIDVGKPMMISEAGSVVYPSASQRTADWYRGIPEVLTAHPRIKAVAVFDRHGNGSCAYRFDDVPEVASAVGETAASTEVRWPPFGP